MTGIEMVEEFVCPGCVAGSDTNCGSYEELKHSDAAGCINHVVGTHLFGVGSFALGLPKGFNRAGLKPNCKGSSDYLNQMWILCWTKDQIKEDHWNKFNVPVWAMEKDGYLFVRTLRPRINESCVEVVKDGTLDMFPGAIDVGDFYEEID